MMKQIDLETLNERNDNKLDDFMRGVLNMEFIKYGNNYIIKDSNGKVVSEEEKLKLEKKELVLKDIQDCGCQGETTKKISKINKKLKEIVDNDKKITKAIESGKPIKVTGKPIIEVADDTIEETNSTL